MNREQSGMPGRSVRRIIPAALLITGLTLGGLATGAHSGTASAATLSAALSLGTPAVTQGSVLSISGTGFLPGEFVDVSFLSALNPFSGFGTPVARIQADATGTIAANIVIPTAFASGTYTLVATGETSHISAYSTVTVNAVAPSLVVNVNNITAGSTIAVAGHGFAPYEMVSITLSGQTTVLATAQADASGNLPLTNVTIPISTAAGSYTLDALGASSGGLALATLTVNAAGVPTGAALTVSAVSIAAGGVETVSGSGFTPGELINLTVTGQPPLLAEAVATTSGGLSSTAVPIPSTLAPGTYTLVATGVTSGHSISASILVTSMAATATTTTTTAISLDSMQYAPNGVVTITGAGFTPWEPVTVTATGATSGISTTLPPSALGNTVYANSTGGLVSVGVTIPSNLTPGFYTLTVKGSTSGVTGTALLIVI